MIAHLVVHALEAAERVEHAVAPQELIGGRRQFVAIGAELQVLAADSDPADSARRCRPAACGRTRRRSRRASMPVVPTARNSPPAASRRRRRSSGCPARARPAAIRWRSNGRAIQPAQHSPSSTPSVALWVAAAKAVKANSRNFSIREVRSPCSTSMNSDSTDRPAKMSVSSMLASQGSAVVRISARLSAISRNGLAMPNTRSVSCRIHSVASAWMPRLIQKLEALAEMQIEAEHGRAARDQIALVPARQIAAGVPLQQRIAVPQRRRDQHQGNGDGGRPRPRPGRRRARARSAW